MISGIPTVSGSVSSRTATVADSDLLSHRGENALHLLSLLIQGALWALRAVGEEKSQG